MSARRPASDRETSVRAVMVVAMMTSPMPSACRVKEPEAPQSNFTSA